MLIFVDCEASAGFDDDGDGEGISMLNSESDTGFFNLRTLFIARPSSMMTISLSRNCFRGLGHGHMWGTATTAKEASNVPAKRVEVALERGWRWDGIVVRARVGGLNSLYTLLPSCYHRVN